LAVVLAEQSVQSKRDRALQLAEVNARQYSRDPEALATLGWVNYRMGKQQEAERLLRAAMSSGQVRADTAYYFARVLTERGNPDESAQARKVLRSAIEKPGIFVLRGEAERWLAKQEDNDRP